MNYFLMMVVLIVIGPIISLCAIMDCSVDGDYSWKNFKKNFKIIFCWGEGLPGDKKYEESLKRIQANYKEIKRKQNDTKTN